MTSSRTTQLTGTTAAPARGDAAPPRERGRGLLRRVAAPIAAAATAGVKFAAVLVKLKVVTVFASMAVSVGAYALLGGWWFGLGLVGLLFAHEIGHVLELRRQGIPASAPLFIPFLGAVVGMKQMPKDAWREAQVALAGPALGSAAAAGVWAAGSYLDSPFLIALAYVGFLINLFNLLPIVPLDGGRAVAALHPAIWFIGLVGLAALEIVRPSPIRPMILILGVLDVRRRWGARRSPEARSYYRVTPLRRSAIAFAYVGLAVLLVIGMSATQVPRSF
jgi:membrane-associated protease RseP (regulator of RpoE activity)